MHAIELSTDVSAPVKTVWDAWTTAEGCVTFFAPEARIELMPDGRYELLFDLDQPEGLRGSEGCTVIGFERPRALAFTWNAPPHLPTIRGSHTTVRVGFEALDAGRTRVKLVHDGWGEGGEWDEGYRYFAIAWQLVLGRLSHRFAYGPIDWANPYTPQVART